jgi:hypothetical protein
VVEAPYEFTRWANSYSGKSCAWVRMEILLKGRRTPGREDSEWCDLASGMGPRHGGRLQRLPEARGPQHLSAQKRLRRTLSLRHRALHRQVRIVTPETLLCPY